MLALKIIARNLVLVEWSVCAACDFSVAGDCVFVMVMAMVRFDVQNAIGQVSLMAEV